MDNKEKCNRNVIKMLKEFYAIEESDYYRNKWKYWPMEKAHQEQRLQERLKEIRELEMLCSTN